MVVTVPFLKNMKGCMKKHIDRCREMAGSCKRKYGQMTGNGGKL